MLGKPVEENNKIIAISAAVVALAACTKEQDTCGVAIFKKGQEVTLNVTTDASATKVTSELNTRTGAVDFKWEAGDKVKVTVGTDTAEFTLESGAGTRFATFTGIMPADGETFDVQYPVTDPDLASQTYSGSEAVPHNMMKFAQTGCTISSSTFNLTPQNAVLRLNLWAVSQTVDKIVVTNKTSSETPKPTYTLNISSGVTLPTTEASARAFFIVVPAGNWNFSAEIFDNAATPAGICSFEKTSSDAYFAANTVLNMPAKKVGKFYPDTEFECIDINGVVWAPVNCGYSSTCTYGLLYQWGRKYGQAADDITPETMTKTDDTEANSNRFGSNNPSTYNWFSGTVDNTLWSEGGKGGSDPCPAGWRIPTKTELEALLGGNSTPSLVEVGGQWGCYFNGTSSASSGVFLPAAGFRSEGGKACDRDQYCCYWSSSPNADYAWYLALYTNANVNGSGYRVNGLSVRCVQE